MVPKTNVKSVAYFKRLNLEEKLYNETLLKDFVWICKCSCFQTKYKLTIFFYLNDHQDFLHVSNGSGDCRLLSANTVSSSSDT